MCDTGDPDSDAGADRLENRKAASVLIYICMMTRARDDDDDDYTTVASGTLGAVFAPMLLGRETCVYTYEVA